jgi:cytosine/adenosine deaminase-related metal-dependent hydrolase
MSLAPHAYRAAWLFPVDQPPIRDGVVEIVAGKIVAVHAYRTGEVVTDLGDVALLPGLINPHTHLEFSELETPLGEPGLDFPSWIRRVITYRRERELQSASSGAWQSQAIQAGLAESRAASVAALGEIATIPCDYPRYATESPQVTVFLELLGLAPERQPVLWQAAQQHLQQQRTPGVEFGLSPHAPYTVQPELLKRVCAFSAAAHFPVAMHLAESLEELELLQAGSGRLASFLAEMNALPHGVIPRGVEPRWYLEMLAQASRALVIHGNYLNTEEMAFLGEHSERMSVVYCPRTHAYFNAGQYPLAAMLAANVNVCFGTDSRATNPNLSVWEEMLFAGQRHPQVSPAGILHLGTLGAAEALGREHDFGSITVGKFARFTEVNLSTLSAADPHELLWTAARTVRTR